MLALGKLWWHCAGLHAVGNWEHSGKPELGARLGSSLWIQCFGMRFKPNMGAKRWPGRNRMHPARHAALVHVRDEQWMGAQPYLLRHPLARLPCYQSGMCILSLTGLLCLSDAGPFHAVKPRIKLARCLHSVILACSHRMQACSLAGRCKGGGGVTGCAA